MILYWRILANPDAVVSVHSVAEIRVELTHV